ncbi:double zinc ribbon domain-containing protein [Lutibacter sp.]
MKATNCPNCGNKLNKDAKFCGSCGQKVIQPTKDIKVEVNLCPKCKTPFETDEKFCAECGTPINGSTPKKVEIQQKEQFQKSKPQPVSTPKQPTSTKKKKGGVLRTIGKIVVGFIAFVIVGSILLYNLGDATEDTSISQEDVINTTTNIEKENTVENKIDTDNEIEINNKNSAEQYRFGIDVQPNQYKAFELYKKLADKGDLNAMVELSDYYEQGIWVKKDTKKAIKLLQKAADAGSLAAKWQLEFLENEK